MANDFAVIHIHTGDDPAAPDKVISCLNGYLNAKGYTRVPEASLNPYDPRLNLVGQRSRSLYISPVTNGWVSLVDEDIFRLDEPTAEALLTDLSALGPTILLWSIDQFVWGYSIAAEGRILDRYTEDYIEFDAYNPTFLHAAGLSVEQQGPRYSGQPAALAQFMDAVGRVSPAPKDAASGRVPPTPTQTQHSALTHAEHYISGYHQYYRAAADNEITYMDELIAGGQIYADAWAKELAADLGITQPELMYSALVRAEANGELPPDWQAATYRRPAIHQPNYSVALTLYCSEPLTSEAIARVLDQVTATLTKVGKRSWNEIEMAGAYYPDAAAVIEKLQTEGLAEGEHLAARYYPGCNLIIQRRGSDLPHDVIFLEYPSIIDDSYTPDVLERAPEVAALQKSVLSRSDGGGMIGIQANSLFDDIDATYGYISVAGGGVGGDGGGRANGPGAMLADALAKPLAQLSSRVAVKEAASWRERWHNLERNIRGVYWANLFSDSLRQQLGSFAFLKESKHNWGYAGGDVFIELRATIADYADGKAEAEIEQLREKLLPLLQLP